ncbi:hypothetical protein GUITHDRAFT_107304 [Guillardia theta CCMP2712]|uniref:Uncharacterized protein n=1 Tax=Guillardia theta (strain CCMP2712) TaxID=905079 RepID=L1JEJ7_GUITC|nr:hypothetical protein GUITHDRAFT_107304 [Guillardia theta CCMP2712]EKX46953.1 hypothetical protein GUITHDRAFT_107304 [Guillardia theta CCMP2712]|eukprot:XP_005833933.1 hypothetical protein GUITHDRAFT_107304 [Guillardia theta CCMP2712]
MSIGLRTPFDAYLEKKEMAEEERKAERRRQHAMQHEIRKEIDHNLSHQLKLSSMVVQSRLTMAADHSALPASALVKKIDNKLQQYRQLKMNQPSSLPDALFRKSPAAAASNEAPDLVLWNQVGRSSQQKYVPENAEQLRAETIAKQQMIQNRKVQSDKLIKLVKSNERIHDCIQAGGDPLTAIKLLRMIETSVHEVDKDGKTCLGRCLEKEPITSSKIQVLIEANADVNTVDSKGRSCVMKAVEMIDYFCSRGANVNLPDQAGNTPLIEAACRGNKEVVRKLLTSKADPRKKDRLRRTPLEIATLWGRKGVVLMIESWLQDHHDKKHS